jgi:hypothetical protein
VASNDASFTNEGFVKILAQIHKLVWPSCAITYPAGGVRDFLFYGRK